MADLTLGHVRIETEAAQLASGPGYEYGPATGYPALREAIAAWESVPCEEVAITTGASLALAAALATLKRPCSVLCPRPYYPAYATVAEMFGIDLLYYEVAPDGSRPAGAPPLAHRIRPDTGAVLWNFPHNPTGSLASAELLDELADLVDQRDLLLISDEVYADLVYEPSRQPPRWRGGPEQRFVRLRSFSKVFGMPGERLGYVIARPPECDAIARAHWALAMSPPATAQFRGLAVLRADPGRRVHELRRVLAEQRNLALRILSGCPRLRVTPPAGGVFCWLEVRDVPGSVALAAACAKHAGVHVMPGTVFGVDDPTYLRVSFAVPRHELVRGLETLVEFLGRI